MASNPFDYAERFNPNRHSIATVQRRNNPTDPVGEELERMREQEIRATLVSLPKPEETARVTRLAREAEVNPTLVEGDPETVEQALRARRFTELARQYPAIGKFAVQNPRAAAAAQDDSESLGVLGSAWNGLKKLGSRIVGSGGMEAAGMVGELYNQVEELNEFLATPVAAGMDAFGFDVKGARKRAARDRQARRDYFRQGAAEIREANRGDNWITEGLLAGTESSILTLGAVATRSPGAAATVFGTLSGAKSMQEGREAGLSAPQALRYGATQGLIEGATELIPAGTLVDLIARKTPWGKAFVRELGQEMTGEQVATFLQDANDYAMLPEHRGKTLGDFLASRPEAAMQTALAVAGGTAVTTGAIGAAQRATDATVRVSDTIQNARQARKEGEFFDKAAKAAEGSKLRARDPEAFRALLREQAEDAGASDVFIPSDAVREFFQSDRFDPDSNPFTEWVDDGGDLVMPVEDVLTDLVGTPAWDAIKDHVRLTPGGMSRAEAAEAEANLDETMGKMADTFREQELADAKERAVFDGLVDALATQWGASFAGPAARQIATLQAMRMAARAKRLGVELTPESLNGFQVRQVMPEGVREAIKADELDLVINAMRKRGDAEIGVGSTLLEWIKKRGGLNDTGGDLRSMGVAPGLIREFDPDQGALSGLSGAGVYGLDTTFQDALEAGFFPEFEGFERDTYDDALDGSGILLEAIGAELAGTPRYATVRADRMRAIADDLRAVLEGRGLSPDDMSDSDLRAAIDGLSAEEADGRAYEQEARGRIIFDQNRRIIELFQSRNLSTPIHELSHMWLEELRFDASLPDAPQQVKDDWQRVQSYFAANGHVIGDDGQIPTEAHELWARSGERYLMEGKAPSSALTRLFETFRGWLINIYRTVDRLRAPITPEIREVFDRLLATDEEIEAVRERQALGALLKDAAEVGMSEAEFSAYQRQVDEALSDAASKLLDKTMATIRRREQDRYREARKSIKAEEQERIDGSPLFKALALMKEQRISREWIGDEMGVDALDLLPVRVPPLHTPGGVDPNVIAEIAGYTGARDMIEALIGAERAHRQAKEGGDQRSMRARAIETAADTEFARRYGDPLNDGSIEREALAAVHGEKQGEVIASELRILSRKTGQRPTPWRIARDWARNKVRSGVVAQEASPTAIQRYARNAAKAGRLAEEAMLKQDANEAFRQKQFQMLNGALLAEAKAAEDEVQSAVKRMDKIARAKTRKSVDQDYLEQAQALLEAVDLRARSQVGIERQGKWADWAAAREAEGFDVVVPPSFEATIGKTNWSRLSVENLLALDEAVKQVMHLGRLKQELLDNQDRREFDEVVREAEAGGDKIGRKPPQGSFTDPSWWERTKSAMHAFDAGLLRMEQVFDWLDSGNANGVFNRVVFRPIAEAQAAQRTMLEEYHVQLKAAAQRLPEKTVQSWADRITLDLIDPETGLPAVMERKKLVAMALNWGNAGNRQRLAGGYGWFPAGIEAVLMDNLSEPEWRYVQEVWDIIGGLWPSIEKMERAINGVAPEKVEPTEIVTPFGTFAGGYYPAIYDSTLDYTAEEREAKKSDLFSANYIRATTRASATKARAGQVSRPILLDLGVINRHLGEVIHDVTHREPVMNAHRFLNDRRVKRMIDETLGPEIRKQMKPWLNFVANSWASERAGNEGIGKFMGKLRANTTVVGMGWRFTTMLTQIAGYSNSFEMVGVKWVAPQIAKFQAQMLGSVGKLASFQGVEMPEMMAFALERSDELRFRLDTLDRDIRLEMDRLQQRGGKVREGLTAAKRFAFHGIGYMDRLVSIPTWVGAFNKATAEGLDERAAAYAADKAIRLSQGAGSPKDLAAVSRGTGRWGEAFKLLTMFYTYLSSVYSRQRNLARDVRRARVSDIPNVMARAWWLIVVPPLLAEILSGRGPEEDEEWGWWAFQKILSQSLGAIPIVRDLTDPVFDGFAGRPGFDYRLSPLTAVGASIVNVAKDVGKLAEGDETKRATRNALEAVGYTTGLVPGQIASSVQFLVDVGAGDADPKSFADWYTGLTKGKLEEA